MDYYIPRHHKFLNVYLLLNHYGLDGCGNVLHIVRDVFEYRGLPRPEFLTVAQIEWLVLALSYNNFFGEGFALFRNGRFDFADCRLLADRAEEIWQSLTNPNMMAEFIALGNVRGVGGIFSHFYVTVRGQCRRVILYDGFDLSSETLRLLLGLVYTWVQDALDMVDRYTMEPQ